MARISPKDKGEQVVDNGNGVVGGKRRNRSAEDEYLHP